MKKTYHVGKNGNDKNCGSNEHRFLTIQRAADICSAGDTVIVHEGTYRESVNPKNGGMSAYQRITYQAATGEKVIIKGSEVIDDWHLVKENVYKTEIPSSFFHGFNPYKEIIFGDWLVYPTPKYLHRGDVYIDGVSLFETLDKEALFHPIERKKFIVPHAGFVGDIPRSQDSLHPWYCEVEDDITTIYVNFGDINPDEKTIEINVRETCFYPLSTHINYITVRGFEMAMAATPWAPPTSDQVGLIGPHWSKGWIIENNSIHDAKCSAISLGKEITTGDNECSKFQITSGYHNQLEAVFKGLQIGWDRDTIGSHVVRNNTIYSCGQNGIVGHLGCAFSEIYHNHIYDIGKKHEYFGWEIAGIKFHAAIDVLVHDNCIHDCSLGFWFDWQTQGTRLSRNVFFNNEREGTIEVSLGPFVLDNNIFASSYNIDYLSQGGAFIHNLFCGENVHRKVLDRSTPYHFEHSTAVKGCSLVYGGDDRILNNIIVGRKDAKPVNKNGFFGTAAFDPYPSSNEEYHKNIVNRGNGDIESFINYEQPVMIDGNVYLNGAKKYKEEKNFFIQEEDPQVKIAQKADGVYLSLYLDKEILDVKTSIHDTESLGTVRIVGASYENKDGSPMTFDHDLLGEKRTSNPTPGPLESLKSGSNTVQVFRF